MFYYSPYLRAKQTLDEIMPFFDAAEVFSFAEEPRISEQQIGNFQNVQQVLGKCEYHHILSMNTYDTLMLFIVDTWLFEIRCQVGEV